MPITYVGGKGAGAAGQGGGSISLTTGLTGGSGGAPIEGDIVVVTVSVGTAARQPTISISTPSGYTALTAQRTTATTYDTNVQTCYKVMGSTPDTTVTIPASGNNQDGISYAIQVFRGVDTATPMDATATYATGSGTDNLPNGAAITPVTAGAWIVVCGGGAAAAGGTYAAAALTNFITNNGPDTNDANVGCGYYTGWTSGSYDPAAFTGGSANAANSWGCTTIALRPAPEAQALTQSSRFDNSASFYGPTVTTSFTATQSSRFDNSEAFYAATVTAGEVALTQSARFDNSSTIYAPTVQNGGAPQNLTQDSRLDNTSSFYAATLSASISLTQASRFDNAPAFYAATVTPGAVALTQASRFDATSSFFAPTLSATYSLTQASRFDNSGGFYAATLSATYSLTQASRFDNSNSFYAATVTVGPVTLTQATRFDNANSFFTPTVNPGPVALTQASRFDNSNTVYAHNIGLVTALTQASRFDNTASFYGPVVTTLTTLLPTLVVNTNAFYSPQIIVNQVLTQAARFDNANDFYAPIVTPGGVTLTAGIVVNAQAFYGATLVNYSNAPSAYSVDVLGEDNSADAPSSEPAARVPYNLAAKVPATSNRTSVPI